MLIDLQIHRSVIVEAQFDCVVIAYALENQIGHCLVCLQLQEDSSMFTSIVIVVVVIVVVVSVLFSSCPTVNVHSRLTPLR